MKPTPSRLRQKSLSTHPELPTILGLDLSPEPPGIRVVRLQPWPVPFPVPQEERQYYTLCAFQSFWRSLARLPNRHHRLTVAAAVEAHDREEVLPWLERQGALLRRYPTPIQARTELRPLLCRHSVPFFAWTAYALALQAAYLHCAPEHLVALGQELRRARSLLDRLADRLAHLTEALLVEPVDGPWRLLQPSERR